MSSIGGASATVGVVGDDDLARRLTAASTALEWTPIDADAAPDVDEDPSCWLVAHDPPAVEAPSLVAALRERDPDRPLFALADDADVQFAAVDAGATGTLPAPGDEEAVATVASRVWRAVDDYRERRDLERDSEMFNSLMEAIPVSIYFKDRAGRHLRVSKMQVAHPDRGRLITPDGECITSEEEFVGKTDFDLYPEALAEESYADDLRVIYDEEPIVEKVEEVPHYEGGKHWVTTTKVPWYGDDGEVRGLIGISYRITDRKRRELQLRRQNERLEEFVDLISHDLRNPLTVAQMSLENAIHSDDEGSLCDVQSALERVEALVDDLRTIARHSAAVEDPDPVPLERAVDYAWQAVPTRGAALEVDCDGLVISADESRLVELLENLFRNSVEHGSEGAASVGRGSGNGNATDRGRRSEREHGAALPARFRDDGWFDDDTAPDEAGADVTVTVGVLENGFFVADDGPGVPADERERVFEHGFTTEEGGTGFGLSIVRSIAEAHGWQVALTEADGGGARFEITDVSAPIPNDRPLLDGE